MTGDPYEGLFNKKTGKIVPGGFGGRLVNSQGQQISSGQQLSSKEKQAARAAKKETKKVQVIFHVSTFTQICDDEQVRMMFRIINENPDTKRSTVLLEFGYTLDQLEIFKGAIRDHTLEIQDAKEKEMLGDPPAPPEGSRSEN